MPPGAAPPATPRNSHVPNQCLAAGTSLTQVTSRAGTCILFIFIRPNRSTLQQCHVFRSLLPLIEQTKAHVVVRLFLE
jgi:hypothetical protein